MTVLYMGRDIMGCIISYTWLLGYFQALRVLGCSLGTQNESTFKIAYMFDQTCHETFVSPNLFDSVVGPEGAGCQDCRSKRHYH